MVFGPSLCKYSATENHPHLCSRKGLKTIFWLLHWPHLSKYNEIYKWEKIIKKAFKERISKQRNYFCPVIPIMWASCVFVRKREGINILWDDNELQPIWRKWSSSFHRSSKSTATLNRINGEKTAFCYIGLEIINGTV